MSQLAARGQQWAVASRKVGFTTEGVIPVGGQQFTVRLQMSDAILVRSGIPWSNPQSGRFSDFISLPTPTLGVLPFYRQWVSVDISSRGQNDPVLFRASRKLSRGRPRVIGLSCQAGY